MDLQLHVILLLTATCGSMSTVQECGTSVRRSRQPRTGSLGRIIHGKQSVRGAWPWQLNIRIGVPSTTSSPIWVSRALVRRSPDFIRMDFNGSALHKQGMKCLYHFSDLFNLPLPALWTAVLGDWDQDVEEYSEQRIQVEEIILHERFHNFQHDIALMKLSRPVKLAQGSRISSVCLPTKRLIHNQTDLCIATGWGRAAEDGPLAGKLLEARVPVHDNALCRKKYQHAVSIRSGHLCAGHLDGSTGTCVGDSGGPLQCASSDGKWILAGITSFGSGCAKPGFPDVYTRLSYYIPWIKAKLKKL